MAISSLSPYLNFNGNAEEVLRFYEKALDATVENLMRYGDMKGHPFGEAYDSKIMHCALRLGGGVVMLSDVPPGSPVQLGNASNICLSLDDVEDAARKFAAMAEGGKITQPLEQTFWGATFGMLDDKFGVPWMFNCEHKKG